MTDPISPTADSSAAPSSTLAPVAPGPPAGVAFFDNVLQGNQGMRARGVRFLGVWCLVIGSLSGSMLFLAVLFPTRWVGVYLLGPAATATMLVSWWVASRPNPEARRRAEAIRLPLVAHGRVRCNARRRPLARILSMDPIDGGEMFEPRVFLGMCAIDPTRSRARAEIAIGTIVIVVVIALHWHFRTISGNFYMEILAVLVVSGVGASLLFPTYLRVVPGWLDILECGFLGRRIVTIRRLDLREPQVLVDLSRQIVEVKETARTTTITFGALWDRWSFAHAVLMAAVSTHMPAPLPDDQLLG